MPLYMIKIKNATVFLKNLKYRHKNRTHLIVTYNYIKNKLKKMKKTLAF
jgi:hypothetical protein